METLFKDIRYGVRGLLKRPGFTVIALITLALGIGANTAIFSVVNAVLLRPLPYQDPSRLVTLWGKVVNTGADRMPFSYPNFTDYRNQVQAFERVAAYDTDEAVLASDDTEAETLSG